MGKRARIDVAQGSLSSLAAFSLCCGLGGEARENLDYLLAAPQEPGPLEEPQGRRAGPALP
jgi:hypothetical protein